MTVQPAMIQRLRRAGAGLLLAAMATLPVHALEINWGSGSRVEGSGKPASETRPLSDFQAISAKGPVRLVVRQGTREAVEVRADDNLLPLIETTVESGSHGRTLVVGLKKGQSIRTRGDMVVTVDVVQLKSIATAGSGDVKVEALKTPALVLNLAGSADASLASLQTDELSVSISGSGDVNAAGSAGRLKVSIAGSGDVRTANLRADDVTVSIAGSGDADVAANKSLSVSIAGSGDVVYRGDAQLKSSIVGSGSVTRR
jgi:hypothetical protein